MKKHLVVVCGNLYPNPSPTGLCAARYASLLTDKFFIEFIALSANGREEEAYYDGCLVHTISSKRIALEHRCKGVLRNLIHLLGASQLKLSLMGNLGWFVDAANKKLEEINNKKKIDAILTVCSPFQAHLAGVIFNESHPDVRFCAYTVDPYASSSRVVPFFRQYEDFVKLERSISSRPDCLFLSEEAINVRQDLYGGLNNCVALPYLLPEAKEVEGNVFDQTHIHCVYAGSFYKDIRNPEYMLRVFSSLEDEGLILHLYSSGCDDMVRKYADKNPRIKVHGYVSQEELQKVYVSCDILIGVGNAMNDFLPSKTYEYLSMRRPIVFFNPSGFPNLVLESYSHSLQISDDTPINKAVKELSTFISTERGKSVTKEELHSIYRKNTPESVRAILLQGLKENENG